MNPMAPFRENFSVFAKDTCSLAHVRVTCCHVSRKRGFDLISDVLPFDRLWYAEPNAISNAICNAKHRITHMML